MSINEVKEISSDDSDSTGSLVDFVVPDEFCSDNEMSEMSLSHLYDSCDCRCKKDVKNLEIILLEIREGIEKAETLLKHVLAELELAKGTVTNFSGCQTSNISSSSLSID